ncbi:hypothetical protein [Azospirillum doebereinerae]
MAQKFDRLPEGPLSIADAVQHALNYCNFGRLDFCDLVCSRILQADPDNINAALIQGLSAYKRRDTARAAALLRAVTERAPGYADAHHHLGVALFYDGQHQAAAAAFAQAMALRADYAEPMAGFGDVLRLQGHKEEAFPILRHALELKPNYSPAYIPFSILCFERSLPPGAPPAERRPPRTDRPLLTMASLGNYGRFAQTVNEYVAMRLYAERYGMEFATPDWVGHHFFTLDDPAMDPRTLADFDEWLSVRDQFAEHFDGNTETPFRDRDLFLGGSPVNPMRLADRERVQGWLTPRDCWRDHLDPPVEALRRRGRTLIALHIRQTDWWDKAYTPLSLYLSWLEQAWSGFDDPVLFVSTDEPKVVAEFARYRPATSADFPRRWDGLDYLQDFHVLSQADVLAVSTGSFAMTAAALNRNATLFLRPAAENRGLESFSPWI